VKKSIKENQKDQRWLLFHWWYRRPEARTVSAWAKERLEAAN